jgi:microcystin-dependent protein
MKLFHKILIVSVFIGLWMDVNTVQSQAVATLNFRLKSHMQAVIATDGQIALLSGESGYIDQDLRVYWYNASSNAADDGENVVKPTPVGSGNGRYIKIYTAIPTGSIYLFAGTTAPMGYLLCDGAAISRTTYAYLFARIGTTYGSGDGSTTFNIPDLRQRFPLGLASSGTGSTLGGSGGTIDHLHTVDPPNTTTGSPSATVAATILAGGAASTTHTHDLNIAQFNSGTANPPFLVVNYIIKY